MDVLFVLLALETFHIGESGAGLLNAALGLGTIVGGALTFSLVGRQHLARPGRSGDRLGRRPGDHRDRLHRSGSRSRSSSSGGSGTPPAT